MSDEDVEELEEDLTEGLEDDDNETVSKVFIKIKDNRAKVKVRIDELKLHLKLNVNTEEEVLDEIFNRTNLTQEDINNVQRYMVHRKIKNGVGHLDIKIRGNETKVKIKFNGIKEKFNLDTGDRDEVMEEIFNRTNITQENIDNLKKFKFDRRLSLEDDEEGEFCDKDKCEDLEEDDDDEGDDDEGKEEESQCIINADCDEDEVCEDNRCKELQN